MRSSRKESLTPEDNFGDRPLTSASNNSFMSSGSSNAGGIAPPRLPRKNGYGGFGPPGTNPDEFEPEPFGSRAGTFPRPSEPTEAPARTPSAPGLRPDRLSRPDHERKRSMGPDTSRAPPPRTSLLRPTTSGRDAAPPVDLASEFGANNPYHTPSTSTSSGASVFSHGRQTSSQSSSQSSTMQRGRRKPSDTSGFDSLMNELESSMAAMPGMNDMPPPPPKKSPRDPYFSRREPSEDFRNDPAIQGGRPRARSPLATQDRDATRYPTDRYDQGHERQPSDLQSVSSPPRTRRRDPAVQPSRGNCKSCGDPIKGKSISSADGRLTGRYHKACFVCTTCREPFSSAEFYVLDDKPYCEQHYHKLNGSLCGTCGRGIEGQYLEDEERVKYHVGCFRCGDCGMSLSNGYFEVNGRAFCERDAWRRVQKSTRGPPPGSLGVPGGPGGPGDRGRRPSNGQSGMRPPVGLPRGQRMPPGAGLAAPMPRMNKRMTRLGMM
ncbi:Paxillin-like protein 1 [Colletotrichum truncatum]|uniref:Paxillin-like protein 1 n=1 Tax=Colletotrichum truncatum TaxID=5467 RepID=A0ACC3ZDR8_COLTU